MKLSAKEKKLLILAFDQAAEVGEALAAIRALAKIWLEKYPNGYDLVADLESGSREVSEKIVYRTRSPFADVVLEFGKYRGQRLDETDPSYLLWVLRNFKDLWPETRTAIERYLNL
jgi:hypothetical protein